MSDNINHFYEIIFISSSIINYILIMLLVGNFNIWYPRLKYLLLVVRFSDINFLKSRNLWIQVFKICFYCGPTCVCVMADI